MHEGRTIPSGRRDNQPWRTTRQEQQNKSKNIDYSCFAACAVSTRPTAPPSNGTTIKCPTITTMSTQCRQTEGEKQNYRNYSFFMNRHLKHRRATACPKQKISDHCAYNQPLPSWTTQNHSTSRGYGRPKNLEAIPPASPEQPIRPTGQQIFLRSPLKIMSGPSDTTVEEV